MRANAIAFVALVCSAACSGSTSDVGDRFPDEAYEHVDSTSGAYSIDVRTSPQPPRVGLGAVELRVRGRGGAPADGLAFQFSLVMPAHAHGASVKPTVEPKGEGVYVVRSVSTYMAGTWELRAVIQEGAASDQATITLDVR